MGLPFYVVIQVRKSSNHLQGKGSTSFLSYFKTLSKGPIPEIQVTTSLFVVKSCFNWASSVTVITVIKKNTFQSKWNEF